MIQDQVKNEVYKCSRCGFCQPTCPTFQVTKREHDLARGRNQLVRGIIDGRIEMEKSMKKELFQCLMCNACYTNCFTAVKTDHVMAQARYEYIKQFGQPPLQKYIFNHLLRHPALLNRLMKLFSFGKRTGLSGLVQVLRIMGWFGKNLANAEGLLSNVPKLNAREQIEKMDVNVENPRGKVAFFIGCGINYAFPQVAVSTVNNIVKRGFQVEILSNLCCGLPAYVYGDQDSVRWFAKHNLNQMAQTDADVIITDCASCTSFLKEYEQFLDDKDHQHFEEIKSKIVDISQWLNDTSQYVQQIPADKHQTVTFHDPCHLAHHIKEKKAPREILENISSVEFIEMNESDYCCGGAGSYNIAYYDTSMKILDRKMQNVQNSNAEILSTACPACLIQLTYGVRQKKMPVEVMHISCLVDKNTQ